MTDYLTLLSDIGHSAEVSVKNLKKLEKALKSADLYLEKAKGALQSARDMQLSDEAFETAVTEVITLAPRLFTGQVRTAISTSAQYATEPFKSRLLDLADNIIDALEIVPRGAGWARNADFNLDMNSIAGDLEDYAEAVKEARSDLKVNEERDPEKASEFWRTKVWGSAMYTKTMAARNSHMQSLAPFWSLLNYGTASASMSSDIGGSPYPKQRGYRFVEHTEDLLYRKFRELFVADRARNKELRANLTYQVTELKNKKKEINVLINQLTEQLSNRVRAEAIANKLGISITDRDVDKLIKALTEYEAGSRKGSSRVSLGSRRVAVSRLASLDD